MSAAEVVALANDSGVSLSVRNGKLLLRGAADAVESIKQIAAPIRGELVARLLGLPYIVPAHRTTRDLIFHDPETGRERVIPAGTHCRQFHSPKSAHLAGVPFSHDQSWAAAKNLDRGYALIWLEGMLRGVSFQDVEPLPEPASLSCAGNESGLTPGDN